MFSPSQLQILPPKNGQDLESLCRDVISAEWKDFFAQKNGKTGSSQHGVDIFSLPPNAKGYTGVQCKCRDLHVHSSLTAKQIRDEVAKARNFKPRLKKYIFATSLPRNPKLQQLAREITLEHRREQLFSVHIFFWEDITAMLDSHPRVAKKYYGPLFSNGDERQNPEIPTQQINNNQVHKPQDNNSNLTVIPPHTHHALGIIATAPFPVYVQWLAQFFPKTPWNAEIKALQGAGIIIQNADKFSVPENLKKQFFESTEDRKDFIQEWVNALQSIGNHVDTVFILAIQKMALGKVKEAIVGLVNMAYNLEPGNWRETYRKILIASDKPKVLRLLDNHERLDFLNVLSQCQSQSRKPLDALPFCRRLRRLSSRISNAWGTGQSFINEGIAYVESGQPHIAEKWYRRAICHAKKHHDQVLLGRALHNLVMLTSEYDPAEAERLLSECIVARKAAKDGYNGPGPHFCRGLIAIKRRDFLDAIRWYTKAEKAAAQSEDYDARCSSLCNIGRAHLDLDDPRKSIPFFKSASKLAKQEGFEQLYINAIGGEAFARHLTGQHALAAPLFRLRYDLLLQRGQYEEAAISLHDEAVSLLRAGDLSSGKVFREAANFAFKHGIDEWAYQSLKDEALEKIEKSNTKDGLKLLQKAINRSITDGKHDIAFRLQQNVIEIYINHEFPTKKIDDAFFLCFSTWTKKAGVEENICKLKELHSSWLWSIGRFSEAVQTLRELVQFASCHNLIAFKCEALNQIGVYLQEMGDFKQAENVQRAAVVVARASRNQEFLETALNNLGEFFRQTDRPSMALKPLSEAEAIASHRGDGESVISIAQNRALAIFAAGQYGDAQRLLRNCRDRAARFGWHEQLIRAEHGLANFAWERNRPHEAEQLYLRAIRNAVRYKSDNQIWSLYLNYSNVLHWKKQFREALRYCTLAIKTCDNPVNLFICLEHAAQCHMQAGNTALAIKKWEKFKELAITAGDPERIAYASFSAAKLYATKGNYAKVDEEMKNALKLEPDPTDRVFLLLEYLEMLIALKKEKEAAKVFRDLHRQCSANHDLKEVLVKAHLAVGRHNWSEGKKPLDSLKAFVVALSESYHLGLEYALEVGTQLLHVLMAMPKSGRQKLIEDYECRLTKWLNQQTKTPLSTRHFQFLLWPFRMAKRLLQEPSDGKGLSLKRLQNMIGEELGFSKKT